MQILNLCLWIWLTLALGALIWLFAAKISDVSFSHAILFVCFIRQLTTTVHLQHHQRDTGGDLCLCDLIHQLHPQTETASCSPTPRIRELVLQLSLVMGEF